MHKCKFHLLLVTDTSHRALFALLSVVSRTISTDLASTTDLFLLDWAFNFVIRDSLNDFSASLWCA